MGIRVPVRLRSIEAFIVERHGRPRDIVFKEIRVLQRWARIVEVAIERAWPVDTGFSRDRFASKLFRPDEGIGFNIANDADYVQFIHRAGTPDNPPLWTVLIPAIIRAAAPQINADMRAEIERTEQGNRPMELGRPALRPMAERNRRAAEIMRAAEAIGRMI